MYVLKGIYLFFFCSIMGEDDYIVSKEGELSEGIGIIPRFCRDLFAQADLIHSKNSEQVSSNKDFWHNSF